MSPVMPTRTIVQTVTMVETHCYTCHLPFLVPQWLDNQCRNKGRGYFCPACGKETFYSENELAKLKRKLDSQEARVRYWQEQYDRESRAHEHTEARRRSVAGHLTKFKKRVGAGVCPCCHRTFKQLASHMRIKHPEYSKDAS